MTDVWNIEVGNATWNKEETSIRSRHVHKGGRFSPRSSPEIPMKEIPELIRVLLNAHPDLVSQDVKNQIRDVVRDV